MAVEQNIPLTIQIARSLEDGHAQILLENLVAEAYSPCRLPAEYASLDITLNQDKPLKGGPTEQVQTSETSRAGRTFHVSTHRDYRAQ